MNDLLADLLDWVEGHNVDVVGYDGYWWSPITEGYDFNREIVNPGSHKKYPEGGIGLRTDDDFFAAAILPWKFHALPLLNIVEMLWPGVSSKAKFRLNPDSVYVRKNGQEEETLD